MEIYIDSTLQTISKVFKIPSPQTKDRILLKRSLLKLSSKLNNVDPDVAIDEMKTILSQFKRYPSKFTDRANNRVLGIRDMLPKEYHPLTILDIGAGNTEISVALRQHYRLNKDSVFVVDPKITTSEDVTVLSYVNGKIPLPDKSIDLIVFLAVLHHIDPDTRNELIKEISRISRGFVLIREHNDDTTPEFRSFLDLIHIFWYAANNESYDPLHLMNRDQTKELMNSHQLISKSHVTYDTSNPQRLYYELYHK